MVLCQDRAQRTEGGKVGTVWLWLRATGAWSTPMTSCQVRGVTKGTARSFCLERAVRAEMVQGWVCVSGFVTKSRRCTRQRCSVDWVEKSVKVENQNQDTDALCTHSLVVHHPPSHHKVLCARRASHSSRATPPCSAGSTCAAACCPPKLLLLLLLAVVVMVARTGLQRRSCGRSCGRSTACC